MNRFCEKAGYYSNRGHDCAEMLYLSSQLCTQSWVNDQDHTLYMDVQGSKIMGWMNAAEWTFSSSNASFSFYDNSNFSLQQKRTIYFSQIWRLSKAEVCRGPGHLKMMAYPTYSAGTSLAFAEQSLWLSSLPQTLKLGLLWMRGWVRALAGASESPPNSAAISQVWKLRCKIRQSLNPVISVLLIAIPHARHSAEY